MRFTAELRPDPTRSSTFLLVPPEVAVKLRLSGRPKIQAVIAARDARQTLAAILERLRA